MAKEGVNQEIKFPQAKLDGSLDFSFSGVKTSVLYYVQKHCHDKDFSKSKVVYAFQKSVVDVLVEKSIKACEQNQISTLLVGGGVAANSMLRERLINEGSLNGINVHFPPMILCLDNAAMIAGLGAVLLPKGKLTHNHKFAIR